MSSNKVLLLFKGKPGSKEKVCQICPAVFPLLLLFASLLLLNNILLYAQQKEDNWLNQPIAYIITPHEQEIFLGLKNINERRQFIKDFWQKRDPDLATYINEFKVEFNKRIDFANRYFSTPQKKGWMTDKGMVYILLGSPTEIERNPLQARCVKSELWIYRSIKCGSLLKNLRVCFVDEAGDGDYKLSTVRSYGLEEIPLQAMGKKRRGFIFSYYFNREVSGMLKASAPLSKASDVFIISPMEDPHNIADVIHIGRIFQTDWKLSLPIIQPEQKFSPFLPQFQVDFFRETQGLSYLPLTIKLHYCDFLYKQRGDKNYATLDILDLLYDTAGFLKNIAGNRVSFGLAKERIKQLEGKSFNYQLGMRAPFGNYKLHLYVRDKVASRYVTNWTKELQVPCWEKSALYLSSLILSNQIEKIPAEKMPLIKGRQPYICGDLKIIPNVSKIFQQRENLSVFFQIYNSIPSSKNRLNSYKIDYLFFKDGRFFSKAPSQLPPAARGKVSNILVNFKLINFYPGRYTLQAKVSDRKTNKSASNKIDFIIK